MFWLLRKCLALYFLQERYCVGLSESLKIEGLQHLLRVLFLDLGSKLLDSRFTRRPASWFSSLERLAPKFSCKLLRCLMLYLTWGCGSLRLGWKEAPFQMKWPKCCPVGRYSTSRENPHIIEDAPRASGFPRQVLVWTGGGGGGGGGGDRGGLGADPQVGSTIFRRLHASPAQAVPPWTSPECGELVLLLCWSESDQLWYFGEIVGEGGLLVGVWRQINSGGEVRKSSLLSSLDALQWPLYKSGAGKKTHRCWLCKWPSPFFEPPLNISWRGPWQSFLLFQPTLLILRMFRFPFPHSPPWKKHFPFLPLSKLNKAHVNLRKTKSGAWQSVGDCNFLSYPVAKIRLKLSHVIISTPTPLPQKKAIPAQPTTYHSESICECALQSYFVFSRWTWKPCLQFLPLKSSHPS